MDTFLKDGNRGMVDALKKMPVRGKLWLSGQAAYDVTYIREVPTPTGRKIRVITNRFVTLTDISGNAQQAQDYSLSALELDLSTEKGKSTGVFFPACEFSMEKEKGIKIEAYRNPWRPFAFAELARRNALQPRPLARIFCRPLGRDHVGYDSVRSLNCGERRFPDVADCGSMRPRLDGYSRERVVQKSKR